MTRRVTLGSLIEMLTRPHMRWREDGLVQVPALLDELDAAVRGMGVTNGQGGGSADRSPINISAFDLRMDIHATAYQQWEEAAGYSHNGSAVQTIADLEKLELTEEWTSHLERVLLEWCDRIESELGRTARVRKLTGVPCPACQLSVYGEDRKSTVYVSCYGLDDNLLPPSDWSAGCKSCGAEWIGDSLKIIIPFLRIDDAKESDDVLS